MEVSWETDVATLLNDLLAVQQQTLDVLGRKLELLKVADVEGLAAFAEEEEQIVDTMRQCLERRKQLLTQAKTARSAVGKYPFADRRLPPRETPPPSANSSRTSKAGRGC